MVSIAWFVSNRVSVTLLWKLVKHFAQNIDWKFGCTIIWLILRQDLHLRRIVNRSGPECQVKPANGTHPVALDFNVFFYGEKVNSISSALKRLTKMTIPANSVAWNIRHDACFSFYMLWYTQNHFFAITPTGKLCFRTSETSSVP